MKKFTFNANQRSWDQYQEFHRRKGPFVEFETGRVILTHIPDVYERKYYPDYGIQLVSTTDPACPVMFTNKEDTKSIPKSWVKQGGQQIVAIDWEQERAIGVDRSYGYQSNKAHNIEKNTASTANVTNACVLWNGANKMPFSSTRITVNALDREVQKRLLPILTPVRQAISAIVRMEKLTSWNSTGVDVDAEVVEMHTVQEIITYYRNHSNSNMLPRIAKCGFNPPRRITEHTHLYVKKDHFTKSVGSGYKCP